MSAPVIFEITPDHRRVDIQVDEEDQTKRLVFIDNINSLTFALWIGDLSGAKTRVDLPSDLSGCLWDRGWLVVKLRTSWDIGSATYNSGTLLGISFDKFLEGSRAFEVLFVPGPRRISSAQFWAGGRLVVSVMENLVPSYMIFAPSNQEWTRELLGHMPNNGMFSVNVSRLDEDENESDGALLVRIQDPLRPEHLLLTSVTSTLPRSLKRAPAVFDSCGLIVSWHETLSTVGERIPYVQIGPQGESGNAPVYMTGYGGFNSFARPFEYRGGVGKMWLERGGTAVVAIIRGGGEFGPEWHEAGRREGKKLSHDDFAAVATDLVARKVTRPGRIAAEGSSNGGLLILNMLTRYPGLFGALNSNLPLADMWRYPKLLVGSLWIGEYGNPSEPADWEFLQHISPYHNITTEGISPPILMMTTRRDDRVHPGHARKMTAMLQSFNREAWFFELEAGGHGFGKSSRERARFRALMYAFMRRSINWYP